MSNEEDVAPYLLDVYMPRVKEFMEILKGVGFRDVRTHFQTI